MKIDNFKDNLIPFQVEKMQSVKTIWMDKELLKSKTQKNWCEELFSNEFAYGIKGNENFESIIFDFTKVRTVDAERYGGYGMAENGGGARCGNFGAFQVKGVGKNILSGVREKWHSYGGLCLADAIPEAIYSAILNDFLPLGAVSCLGVIYTGRDTAFAPSISGTGEDQRGAGALLVREQCLRPAHFLRNGLYEPPKTTNYLSDVERLKKVNRELYIQLKGEKNYVQFLGGFLSNYANQFAFARVHRIFHGSLSPSNISLDGRWVDLATTSFISYGKNYISGNYAASFYREYAALNYHIEEFANTFAKYNEVNLRIAPLFHYYENQFNAYIQLYIGQILGLKERDITKEIMNSNEYITVCEAVYNLIMSGKNLILYRNQDCLAEDDLVKEFIESLYGKKNEFSKEFYDLMSNVFLSGNMNSYASFPSFLISRVIRILKRLNFIDFFSRTRIINLVRKCSTDKEYNNLGSTIQQSIFTFKWLFEINDNFEYVLFKNENVNFFYDQDNTTLVLQVKGQPDLPFNNEREAINYFDSSQVNHFYIDDFSFNEGILNILETLILIKSS